MRLWFGAHNGKDLKDVPDDYLVWLVERTQPPTTTHNLTDAQKKQVREKWKDLLSAAEDEIFERQENNPA